MQSIQYLVEDISRLPIITNPHQELWLGVQLQAGHRLALIQAEWVANPTTASDFSLFLWQTLLTTCAALEQTCPASGLPVPRVETWATDLLTARRDIYQMRRSRMRRFIRQIKESNQDLAQQLLESVYTVAETLAILPNTTLDKLIEFAGIRNRLPSINEVNSWPPLEPTALREHARRQVDQTQQILTTGYLRYAMRIAQSYIGQGVPYADLVQVGFIGLFRAADKFDYRVQVRFGAYATNWIWQAIGREIANQGRIIRLPAHIHERLRKWRVACELFDDGCCDLAQNPHILFHAGFLEQDAYDELQNAKNTSATLSAETVASYEAAILKACKLHTSVISVFPLTEIYITPNEAPDKIEPISDTMPDNNFHLHNLADAPFVRQVIEDQLLSLLTGREQKVLALRCGWGNDEEHTLEEIAKKYGLSRERIRQIEDRALKTLRNRLIFDLSIKLDELLPEDKPSQSWLSAKQIVLPAAEAGYDEDLITSAELDTLLSQLPSSDWIKARLGARGEHHRIQLIAAIKRLAAPAHVSDITEQLNEALEGQGLEDTRVYSFLIQDEETFILLGQSVFSLTTWEKVRSKAAIPVLPCCPLPLPDPPDYEDAFFESVLVGQQMLGQGLTASQFLYQILNWAQAEPAPPKWLAQTILSAYYLVDLIPYVFYYGGEDPVLHCTLPTVSIQELRYHCLQTLTERLVAMPEFWWLFQQNQPIRPGDLGELFADVHPYGLDDALQRLRLLASLGAAQKLKYGDYRLTLLGEACANRWKREVVVEKGATSETNPLQDFADFVDW